MNLFSTIVETTCLSDIKVFSEVIGDTQIIA